MVFMYVFSSRKSFDKLYTFPRMPTFLQPHYLIFEIFDATEFFKIHELYRKNLSRQPILTFNTAFIYAISTLSANFKNIHRRKPKMFIISCNRHENIRTFFFQGNGTVELFQLKIIFRTVLVKTGARLCNALCFINITFFNMVLFHQLIT